jgi:RNA polymerase sigma factor (TIGR02999 family)
MEPLAGEVTVLLERVRAGDKDAENRLYEIVMPQLRHTLQGTELVHEVYLRLAGTKLSLRDRAHFFAVAARAMRRELIDYARSRPKADVLPIEGLPESVIATSDRRDLAMTIDELLDRMKETMPLECSIVELKFFFGMTDEETAEVLDLPLRSMQSRWHDARIWLFERAEAQQWKPAKPFSRPATT